jgi:4-carboxymuconolactone decarboxylase
MHSRLPLPKVDRFDNAQREIYESILTTRGNINGPFLAWMYSPGLASPAEKLGAFCRYNTVFPQVESELLILCVAERYQCLGEQQIHEPIALKAGLSEQSVTCLRSGQEPPLAGDRQRLIYQLACELLHSNRIAEPLYRKGIATFGERGMVELVGIVGYYTLVAMTLNAFEMKT